MLLIILVIIAVVVAAVLIVASLKPATFRIARSLRIHAPADRIFPFINEFHQWAQWSPFEKLDPAMRKTFGGSPTGRGSTYAWSGNGRAGQGSMEITESIPSSRVVIDLRFERPWKATNRAIFTLESAGDATAVTWAMEGRNVFMAKVMGLFMNMDKMIGKDFEAGLVSLKTLSER
jgi:uncharacterized protein YndB with AHSA1/START domain